MQYIQFQPQLGTDIPSAGDGYVNFYIDTQDNSIKIKTDSGSTITTGGGVTDVTYSELRQKISGSTLVAGSFYKITDFKTCYDQPDFDFDDNAIYSGIYKDDTDIQPIIVFATSTDTISDVAYQPLYPNDKIKYDWTFETTERTGGVAYGRITERIDEFNNRTDYDHRQIKFKRYRYYEINFSNPLNGSVQVTNFSSTGMTVSGTNTNFTSLSVNQKIGFDNFDFRVFEIISIDSDTGMTISGLTYVNLGPNIKMYTADWDEYCSYKQNNVDSPTMFEEYYTFDFNDDNINNYIGNFSNLYNWEEWNFLLANNVFHNRFTNNKFGDACFNNSFFDDCSRNNVGDYFYNNITDDDFDGNVIGSFFRDNKITSKFQYNRIGENFQNNYLVQYYFYRNNIMNYFETNIICNGDFQNNEIGSQFRYNKIRSQFYKNDVGNGFNDNLINSNFYGNLIGNGFNENTIYCEFYENKIGELFEDNELGELNIYYHFSKNDIGSHFYNNDCLGTFAYNRIGSEVYNNTIGDGFGFGYNSSQGNVIGNYFYNNQIGEYFYNNTISDGFFNNNVYDYFQRNNVKVPELNGIDFTVNFGNITGFTYTANGSSASDNTYTNVLGTTNADGINASFDIEVSGSTVIGVSGNTSGKLYHINDTITIIGSEIGGTDTVDDVVITVTGISETPSVYELYNCELFKNSGNINRLSFYDENDILTIKNINE